MTKIELLSKEITKNIVDLVKNLDRLDLECKRLEEPYGYVLEDAISFSNCSKDRLKIMIIELKTAYQLLFDEKL